MKTMKMKVFLTALPLALSLAMSAAAQARTVEGSVLPPAQETGREVAAPSWSAACTNDQGQTQCGEPMWVYGSPGAVGRYKNAF